MTKSTATVAPWTPTMPNIMARVNITPDGCWEWTGPSQNSGYGRTRWDGRNWGAHRLVYTLLVRPIPDGLHIDHLCMNKPCVNPAHLEPVTRQENTRRYAATITTCVNGHEFTPENTYQRPDGGRNCRACGRRNAGRRRPGPFQEKRTCEECNRSFIARSRRARFCQPLCKNRARHRRERGAVGLHDLHGALGDWPGDNVRRGVA